MELSQIAKAPAAGRSTHKLFKIALEGLAEARKQQNSLFHVQCVVVIAICALCKGNEDLFTSLDYIAAKLKKAFGIKLNQKGIWQLTSIMNKIAPGSPRKLFTDSDEQMKLMKSQGSPIINWTINLDEMHRRQMVPRKRAYAVMVEKEVLKLEAL